MATNKYDKVLNLVEGLREDFDKFYNKNVQAAGTRVRGGLQELKKLAQEIRIEVQDIKNKSKN